MLEDGGENKKSNSLVIEKKKINTKKNEQQIDSVCSGSIHT